MLTNAAINRARPDARAVKIWDEGGLYLHVSPAGAKVFRCRFRRGGREATITLGHWPEISLAEARDARDQERLRFLGGDVAPIGDTLATADVDQAVTFRAFGLAWIERQRADWSAEHAGDVESYLVRHTFPAIGDKPLAQISAGDIIRLLRAVEDNGTRQLARRLSQWLAKILELAKFEELITDNPAAGARVALAKPPEPKPKVAVLEIGAARAAMAAIAATPAPAAELLASRFLALTGARTASVLGTVWEEIDGVDWADPGNNSPATWTIPPARLKLSVERKGSESYAHVVPLSRQAIAVLRLARAIAGDSPLVFPRVAGGAAGLSVNALSNLYRRAGLQGRHCPHGWRASFSTIMNEARPADRQAIDAALAHLTKDKVEAAYNRSKNLPLRFEIFQAWADALAS